MNPHIPTQNHTQCPCKLLPWKLSTNTAAEYGALDVMKHRLASTTMSTRNTNASSWSEPLHIAAQHGHADIVGYLLNIGYHVDSGCRNQALDSEPTCPSTPPLHRASYTGALGCIQLLLDHGADLSIKDTSFGDHMTPLHKAVKGGRYHAVTLILLHAQSHPSKCSLQQLLHYRDHKERTPLQLAKELHALGKEEILSLRRWNQVAKSQPDFQKCIDLLHKAELKVIPITYKDERIIHLHERIKVDVPNSNPMLGSIHTLECSCISNGENTKISVWEKSFTRAIMESTKKMLQSTLKHEKRDSIVLSSDSDFQNSEMKIWSPQMNTGVISSESDTRMANKDTHNIRMFTNDNDMMYNASCQTCNVASLVFFRSSSGKLICSNCKRNHGQR